MRMAWWVFISLVTVQVILMQYMVEAYLAGHYDELLYYVLSMLFIFLLTLVTYMYFRKIDRVMD